MNTTRPPQQCTCGSDHTSNLSPEATRGIARILFAVHQRAAAEAATAKAGAKGKQTDARS